MHIDIADLAFRFELAKSVCETLRERSGVKAIVTEITCPDCRWFLIEFEDQRIPFCWDCTLNRREAQKVRDLLTRAKLAEKGIVFGYERMPEPPKPKEEPNPLWPDGMPL